jgi:hypothetical protein
VARSITVDLLDVIQDAYDYSVFARVFSVAAAPGAASSRDRRLNDRSPARSRSSARHTSYFSSWPTDN